MRVAPDTHSSPSSSMPSSLPLSGSITRSCAPGSRAPCPTLARSRGVSDGWAHTNAHVSDMPHPTGMIHAGIALDPGMAGVGALAVDAAQRGQVGGRPVGVLGQRRRLVGERVGLGHPLAGHQRQRGAGVERLLGDPAAAGGQRGADRGVEPGGPEQGQRAEHAGAGMPGEHAGLHPALQRGRPVGVEDALGGAGRARGEDHERGVVGRDGRGALVEPVVGHGVAGGEQLVPRRLAQHGHPRQVRSVLGDGGDVLAEPAGQQAGLGEHHRRPAGVHQLGQLGAGREGRHGRGDAAGQRHTEDGGHGLGAVAHEHAHRIAGLDAGGEQRPPDAARLGLEALVGPPHGLAVAQRVVEHDGLVRTEPGRDLAQEPAHRERAHPVGVRHRRALERGHRPVPSWPVIGIHPAVRGDSGVSSAPIWLPCGACDSDSM